MMKKRRLTPGGNDRCCTADNTGGARQLWGPATTSTIRQIGVEPLAERKTRYLPTDLDCSPRQTAASEWQLTGSAGA